MEDIRADILECVGNTPMVRLNRVTAGLQCEVLAKCEYLNPGGSVKDRIGKNMVLRAEAEGRIKKGDTLVEPTSGNTGIGMSMAAAVKGYNMIITLPMKMSKEKVSVMKALGAQVIRTPTEAPPESPESHISVANRLQDENPGTHHVLDQYANPANPQAHEEGTAEEIWRQTGGKVDMVVIAAGTGGTISGVARKLKQKNPNLIVVGTDPDGSMLHDLKAPIHTYHVEGIGYDFIPKVCDRDIVDKWVVTTDAKSFGLARRLIREEGLLVGGSSGSAMEGVLQEAANLKAGQRCVVILPDSVRNYLTKYIDDDWMIAEKLMDPPKGYVPPAASNAKPAASNATTAPASPMPTTLRSLALLAAGMFVGWTLNRKQK